MITSIKPYTASDDMIVMKSSKKAFYKGLKTQSVIWPFFSTATYLIASINWSIVICKFIAIYYQVPNTKNVTHRRSGEVVSRASRKRRRGSLGATKTTEGYHLDWMFTVRLIFYYIYYNVSILISTLILEPRSRTEPSVWSRILAVVNELDLNLKISKNLQKPLWKYKKQAETCSMT